jgi:hypothetical protein
MREKKKKTEQVITIRGNQGYVDLFLIRLPSARVGAFRVGVPRCPGVFDSWSSRVTGTLHEQRPELLGNAYAEGP